VRSVRTLHAGAAGGLGRVRRLRWSSRLPYGFALDVETTALHAPTLLVGCATGDMAGTGTWELAVAGAGTRVRVRDTWTLDLHTRWMRLAAPFMAPLFRFISYNETAFAAASCLWATVSYRMTITYASARASETQSSRWDVALLLLRVAT